MIRTMTTVHHGMNGKHVTPDRGLARGSASVVGRGRSSDSSIAFPICSSSGGARVRIRIRDHVRVSMEINSSSSSSKSFKIRGLQVRGSGVWRLALKPSDLICQALGHCENSTTQRKIHRKNLRGTTIGQICMTHEGKIRYSSSKLQRALFARGLHSWFPCTESPDLGPNMRTSL